MRQWMACLALLLGSGCARTPAPIDRPEPLEFSASRCGAIAGRVVWEGQVPEIEPFTYRTHGHYALRKLVGRSFKNPHTPMVHQDGVAGAVVFLCGVDAESARPWDHPPVQVELSGLRLAVRQGDEQGVGFVRRGGEVEFVSLEETLHVVRVRGADYAGVPLAEPYKPLRRRFAQPGLVELGSGVGYCWMHGYLLVCDHPYITRTDAAGRFAIHDVPQGEYRIVCWMPNWHVEKQIREPEAGIVHRLHFARPMEQENRITVAAGEEVATKFVVYQELFDVTNPRPRSPEQRPQE